MQGALEHIAASQNNLWSKKKNQDQLILVFLFPGNVSVTPPVLYTGQMAEEKRLLATQLFTVRFWLEALGDDRHEWRGRAQHIESGEVIYFRDWHQLLRFCRDNLDRAIQPNSEIQIRRSPMSIEKTREIMARYLKSEHGDSSMMADDVVFTIMGTGQEHRGPQAVLGMLYYFYHVAFDATAEPKNMVYTDGQAVGEWDFVGKHTGEFAGIPATGKNVRVPLCVVYDLENDKIKRGRVYFEMPALLQQLGVPGAAGG